MCLKAVAVSIVNDRLVRETILPFRHDPLKAGSHFSGLINSIIVDDKIHFSFNMKNMGKLLDTSKRRIGYKWLVTTPKGRLSSLFNSNMKKGVWYTSTSNLEHTSEWKIYMTGFHILWNRDDGRKYDGRGTLFKVEYYDQFIYGFDRWNTQVVLAKKMRIIGEA